MNSADYALQAVKGIKESFDNAIQYGIEVYADSRVFNMITTSETFEIFTSTEGLDGSKELAEQETPPSLKLEDGYSVTLTEKRFGGSIVLPEQVYRRDGKDNTLKVEQYLVRQRNQLLKDSKYLWLTRAFLMLNEAFDSTSDYLAPDGVELCGSHTWNSGGTFTNKATAKLSSAAVDTAMEFGGAFTDPAGKPMPMDYDTIVVKKGSDAEREAIRLFAKGISPVAVADINIYEGMFTIISTPYITAANKYYWFMMDSKHESCLYLGIGEMPTLREPIRENNEAIRTNCTGFWKQGINNMPFAIYGSDGTA